jgi:hypothetical protein
VGSDFPEHCGGEGVDSLEHCRIPSVMIASHNQHPVHDQIKLDSFKSTSSFPLHRNIRRIVFSSMEKYDGTQMSTLSSSQVKQIAGRAGRFGTEYHSGLVTT